MIISLNIKILSCVAEILCIFCGVVGNKIKNIILRRGMYGERRGVYNFLMGKPEGRKTLSRPRRRWDGNIKTDL